MRSPSADFESAASASSTIPAQIDLCATLPVYRKLPLNSRLSHILPNAAYWPSITVETFGLL